MTTDEADDKIIKRLLPVDINGEHELDGNYYDKDEVKKGLKLAREDVLADCKPCEVCQQNKKEIQKLKEDLLAQELLAKTHCDMSQKLRDLLMLIRDDDEYEGYGEVSPDVYDKIKKALEGK